MHKVLPDSQAFLSQFALREAFLPFTSTSPLRFLLVFPCFDPGKVPAFAPLSLIVSIRRLNCTTIGSSSSSLSLSHPSLASQPLAIPRQTQPSIQGRHIKAARRPVRLTPLPPLHIMRTAILALLLPIAVSVRFRFLPFPKITIFRAFFHCVRAFCYLSITHAGVLLRQLVRLPAALSGARMPAARRASVPATARVRRRRIRHRARAVRRGTRLPPGAPGTVAIYRFCKSLRRSMVSSCAFAEVLQAIPSVAFDFGQGRMSSPGCFCVRF